MLTGWVVRDDGARAALDQKQAQASAVIGSIAGTEPTGRERPEESKSRSGIAQLSLSYFEGERSALVVNDRVDFGRAPAARDADRLRRSPPFPPAAERCAFAVVLSIM